MDKEKIKAETRELYHDAEIGTLKMLIFLTKCVKNLHTELAIFIISATIPLGVSIYMYSIGLSFSVFLFAMIMHFIAFKFVKYWFLVDNNPIEETYKEQKIIQEELEYILSKK